MKDRERLSVALWIIALAIWLLAGIVGSLPWWLVLVVTVGFGLQVFNAVRLATTRTTPER